MSDILKKAIKDINAIKKGVKSVAKNEIINESKKHLDEKISKLILESEDGVEDLKNDTKQAEHDVDFIDSILKNVDLNDIINSNVDNVDDDTNLNTKPENNIEEMSEFNKTEDNEVLSNDEIKTEMGELETKIEDADDNSETKEKDEEEIDLTELDINELKDIIKDVVEELKSEENKEVENVDEAVEGDTSANDEELSIEEIEEALKATETPILEFVGSDDDIDNIDVKTNEPEAVSVDLKKVAGFVKYLLAHEIEDLVDSNGVVNTELVASKVLDKFNVAEEDEDKVFDKIEDLVGSLEVKDIDEGTSKSFKNAHSVNTKPGQYAEYNADKDIVREEFEKLKALTNKLINENTQLKNINNENVKNLEKIKDKLYEATVMSHKTSYVNQLFLEHTLNASDKKRIVESFIKVNNIEESKRTFETLKEEYTNKPIIKESVDSIVTRTTILATNEVNSKVLAEGAKQTNPMYDKWRTLADGK